MLFEVDTDLQGLVVVMKAVVELNRHDCRRDPELLADLRRRVFLPAGVGFEYKPDPKYLPDRWSTLSVLLRRTRPDRPVVDDCEGQSTLYATARLELERLPVWAVIRQPDPTPFHPHPMAHAYLEIPSTQDPDKTTVFDPSVLNGMGRPPADFYLTGTVGRILLEP